MVGLRNTKKSWSIFINLFNEGQLFPVAMGALKVLSMCILGRCRVHERDTVFQINDQIVLE